MSFESHLRAIVLNAQLRVHPRAFAMFQPPHLTIAYFDHRGQPAIIADARIPEDEAGYTSAFKHLYSQVLDYTKSHGPSSQEM
jgi:hypothetical protein